MVVANIAGGIGNQLYIYAAAYTISHKFNQELTFLILNREIYSHTYSLDELAIPSHKKIVITAPPLFWNAEIIHKLYSQSDKKIFVVTEENFEQVTEQTFSENDIIYLTGNFQREKYHKEYFNEFKKLIHLKTSSVFISEFKKLIDNRESVAVHIRRTDFVYLRHTQNDYKPIFDSEYYKAAVKFLESKFPNCIFMVFSDDIRHAKRILGNRKNLYYINNYGGPETDVEELLCISLCKHKILTNGSSYGRFADKLSDDSNKGLTIYGCHEEKEDKRKYNFIYLSIQTINQLAELYDNETVKTSPNSFDFLHALGEIHSYGSEKGIQRINRLFLDSYYLNDEHLNKLLFIKAKLHKAEHDYGKAELCMVRLWQYYYGNSEFHKLYFEILLREKKYLESILEAVMYRRITKNDIDNLKDYYPERYKKIYDILSVTKKYHFIFTPYSHYVSYFRNMFEIIAFALKRMGHNITFLYKEAPDEGNANLPAVILKGHNNIYNFILQNNYFVSDGLGNNYHFAQYDYERVKAQYNIEDFLHQLCLNSGYENRIICHEPENIKNKRSDTPAKYIFWDFSNEFDLDVSVWKHSGEELDFNYLYENTDIYITEKHSDIMEKPDLNKLKYFQFHTNGYYETDDSLTIPQVLGMSEECMERVLFLLSLD